MIITPITIVVTLIIISVAGYIGLFFLRKFALEIAQENNKAIRSMDAEAEEDRLKKEKRADAAAASAYEKVLQSSNPPKSGNSIV